MKLLVIFISIFLDLLLLNLYRISNISLNYFYPMLTISSVVYLCNFYSNSNRKKYYVFVLIISFIYDSLVTNNLLITVSLFELIAFINVKFKNVLSNNLFNNLLRNIISITCYDFAFHMLLVIVRYQNFNFSILIYKLFHSYVLNLIYISIMFLVLKNKKS